MQKIGVFLKYLWIKNYGCLQEAGFQFDKNLDFEYKESENYLKASTHDNRLPANFWTSSGRIVDIHAIVGDNGRGKTTFLRLLMDIFKEIYSPEDVMADKYLSIEQGTIQALVVVGSSNENYQALCLGISSLKFEMPSPYKMDMITDKLQIRRVLEGVKIAFFSNVFDIRDFDDHSAKAEHISDYSFGGLLKGDYSKQVLYQRNDRHNDPITEQVFHEIYRQVSFMTEFYSGLSTKDQEKMFDSWPKALHINFVSRRVFVDNISGIRYGEMFQEMLSRFVSEGDFESAMHSAHGVPVAVLAEKKIGSLTADLSKEIAHIPERVRYRLCRETFQNLLIVGEYQSFYKIPEKGDRNSILPPIVEAVYKALTSAIEVIAKDEQIISSAPCFFYKILQKELSNAGTGHQASVIAKNYAEMLLTILKLPDELFIYTEDGNFFDYLIEGQTEQNRKIFSQFIVCYKKVVLPYSFLEFDWGMSSGETHLLSLYSRLFALRSVENGTNHHKNTVMNYIRKLKTMSSGKESAYDKIQCNSLWMLIDEMDLTFHPRWQKKLIADICYFIPKILPDRNLKIQIIFTTHSPILLGDIPKENVIYLTRDKRTQKIQVERNFSKNTFGQNIYVLFQDSFFLDTPLGQFASNKLEELLNNIVKVELQIQRILDKKENAPQVESISNKIVELRSQSEVFGDRVIRHKLQERLDICEYRLNAYRYENKSVGRIERQTELEWMRERKAWIEHLIIEMEKDNI